MKTACTRLYARRIYRRVFCGWEIPLYMVQGRGHAELKNSMYLSLRPEDLQTRVLRMEKLRCTWCKGKDMRN